MNTMKKQYNVVIEVDGDKVPIGWKDKSIDEYCKKVIPIYMLQSVGAVTVLSVISVEEIKDNQ